MSPPGAEPAEANAGIPFRPEQTACGPLSAGGFCMDIHIPVKNDEKSGGRTGRNLRGRGQDALAAAKGMCYNRPQDADK